MEASGLTRRDLGLLLFFDRGRPLRVDLGGAFLVVCVSEWERPGNMPSGGVLVGNILGVVAVPAALLLLLLFFCRALVLGCGLWDHALACARHDGDGRFGGLALDLCQDGGVDVRGDADRGVPQPALDGDHGDTSAQGECR